MVTKSNMPCPFCPPPPFCSLDPFPAGAPVVYYTIGEGGRVPMCVLICTDLMVKIHNLSISVLLSVDWWAARNCGCLFV